MEEKMSRPLQLVSPAGVVPAAVVAAALALAETAHVAAVLVVAAAAYVASAAPASAADAAAFLEQLQCPCQARRNREVQEGASCQGDTSAAEAYPCRPYQASCPEAGQRQNAVAFLDPFLGESLRVASLGERLVGAEVVAADALASAAASDVASGIAALDDVA